jgi:hypothetical protein
MKLEPQCNTYKSLCLEDIFIYMLIVFEMNILL